MSKWECTHVKIQPQRLPTADEENERQQNYSGLPDCEKWN